ncbi:MAG TPA: hypothetical protein VHM25_05900 [Polyangiaceae bacterium]|nr:hypothetical protein [Polyangiaceae bacterium]
MSVAVTPAGTHPPRSTHYPWFDYLRIVLAVGVCTHAFAGAHLPRQVGNACVQVVFSLSGFLIGTIHFPIMHARAHGRDQPEAGGRPGDAARPCIVFGRRHPRIDGGRATHLDADRGAIHPTQALFPSETAVVVPRGNPLPSNR